MMSRHRVAIVGCGFGGLFAARALQHVFAREALEDQAGAIAPPAPVGTAPTVVSVPSS